MVEDGGPGRGEGTEGEVEPGRERYRVNVPGLRKPAGLIGLVG